MRVANLDPAAEHFAYDSSFDVRELISLDQVMEEYGYGPNGGLVYCMEFLYQNSDWLQEQLDGFGEDEYVLLDCPGQIELYSHLPVMRNLTNLLTGWGYRVCSVYLLDALFVLEPLKFISGCMLSLSCMMQLELPHINVVTKCDIADKEAVERVLDTENTNLVMNLGVKHSSDIFPPSSSPIAGSSTAGNLSIPNKLRKFTQAIGSVIDDYMIVSFVMLDINEEDSIEDVLLRTDHAIQYGEDVEPKEPVDDAMMEET